MENAYPYDYTTDGPVNQAITGICSFGRYPICTDLKVLKADVAVMGAPLDCAVGYLSGARLAARRIREASTQYGRGPAGYYDFERGEQLLAAPLSIVDCGDADVVNSDLDYSAERIEEMVRAIIRRGAVPIVLGGDHSTTIPVGRGLAEYGRRICVVQFDAHLDWSKHAGRQRNGNGSPMRRLSEMPHIASMAQIGLRGMGSSQKEDYDDARQWGSVLMSARTVREIGVKGVLERIPQADDYFFTIDIDGYDMSIAPGVSSPYPGGLTFEQVTDIISGVAQKGRIVGADVAEVAPLLDPTNSTVRLAALSLMHVIAEVGKQKEAGRR